MPLPEFEKLLDLALHSENSEDMYGAAAIIIQKYPEQLLQWCEIIANCNSESADFHKAIELFNLENPKNRCAVIGKGPEQIKNDYMCWKSLSEIAVKKSDRHKHK